MPRFKISDADESAKAVAAAFDAGRRMGQLDTERAVVRRVDAAVTRGDVAVDAVRSVLLGRPTATPKKAMAAPKPKPTATASTRTSTPAPRRRLPDGPPRKSRATAPPGAVRIQLYARDGSSQIGHLR